jgi:transcriptional regulator GlxA family with amidase domain
METRTPVFAILVYDGIEAIDIGGTYGVLTMAKRIEPSLGFFVVAKNAGAVVMANELRLVADHGFTACPTADVLIVLGGPGWERASADAATLEFIREFRRRSRTVAAVCTGGMILAAAGLLTDLTATTKREIVEGESRPLDLLRVRYPSVRAIEARIVDEGPILTGGGVSLCIDMTLHLLGRFLGPALAEETARILEYRRAWETNAAALGDVLPAAE